MSHSLWPHELQHIRLPCSSLSPRVCSDSCPLSRWCHPIISSSVALFSSCLPSFLAPGSFPMSWLFKSGGQSIGASASAPVLPMNIHNWFPLWLTSLISLLSKGLSRVMLSDCTTARKHQFFSIQPSYRPNRTFVHDYWKNQALTMWTFVGRVKPLLFNMLSRFVIGDGNGNPLQYSCLENPMDGGAWWATVHGLQRVGHDWVTSLHFHFH